jgi:IS4 transposase
VKNSKVKDAIRDYHESKAEAVQRFPMGKGEKTVSFNLAMYPRPGERKTRKRQQSIYDRYLPFATNLSKAAATRLPALIPQEYRRRWGIETGYRVQGTVEAKTTSSNYALRILYHMSSVLIYNIWQYANILLARAAKKPFTRPLIKLGSLAAHFEVFILGGLRPPRS